MSGRGEIGTSNASQKLKKAELGPELGHRFRHAPKSPWTVDRTRSEIPESELKNEKLTSAGNIIQVAQTA